MKVSDLISDFEIWTTNEEAQLLEKLKTPVRLSNLSEHEQFRIQTLIRKSLVTKVGIENPTVVANEKNKQT
jgi:hypothetical protein